MIAFVRSIANGWYKIGLPFYDYSPEFVFSLNICIRVNAVEDIFDMFSGVAPKHHSTTTTTITRLEYFTGGRGQYQVITPEDVVTVGGVLTKIILGQILPF